VLDDELAASAATSPFLLPVLKEIAGDNFKARFRIELANGRGKPTGELLDMARQWAREDPKASLAEAFKITDAETRLKVLDDIQMVWSNSSPDAAIAWAKSTTDPAQLSLGLVRGLSGKRTTDAIAILQRFPVNDAWVEAARDLSYSINRIDLAASANFLVESTEKILATAPALAAEKKVRSNLTHGMRNLCRAWIQSNPPDARAFHDRILARPKLAELLLGEKPSIFWTEMLREENPNRSQYWFFHRLASESGVEMAMHSLPEFYDKNALQGIFPIALRGGNNADIQLVLTAAARIFVDRDLLTFATSHKLALGPESLMEWLQSLRGNERWLVAAMNHVEQMAKTSASNRLAALVALNLFASDEPATTPIQTRVYQSMEYFPEAATQLPGWKNSDTIRPDAPPATPAEALALAANLPTPLHDPLLCRCLLALGREQTAALIPSLPPESRGRVKAWAAVLYPRIP
jgi:hypothetical protein